MISKDIGNIIATRYETMYLIRAIKIRYLLINQKIRTLSLQYMYGACTIVFTIFQGRKSTSAAGKSAKSNPKSIQLNKS